MTVLLQQPQWLAAKEATRWEAVNNNFHTASYWQKH
jgi:hypothetical protein